MKKEEKRNSNNHSLVIRATHGSNTFLFTGDAKKSRLKELPEQMGTMNSIFLKMPYHGKFFKYLKKLLSAVTPKYAAITCGKNGANSETINETINETIDLLNEHQINSFLTSDGNIEVISDQNKLEIRQNGIVKIS